MHIKKIVIENFKCYKGRHVFDGFHRGHNAIVGFNGSGKSSLLETISFVLSNRYYPITMSQRTSVINDNPENVTRSASVEIILSNEDNVLPVDAPLVRIRREISREFNRILINNESFSPPEFFQLFSALVPKENPYYIVCQDEVTQLATGPDSLRFQVISTAIGVHEFDEGLAELLSEISKKSEFLARKTNEMEDLKKMLTDLTRKYNTFHKINKTKRYLEHQLCQLSIRKMKSELSKMEEPYEKELLKAETLKTTLEGVTAEWQALKNEARSIQDEIDLQKKLEKKFTTEDIGLTQSLHSLNREEIQIQEKLQGLESGELESFDKKHENLLTRISELEENSRDIEKDLLAARETEEKSSRETERHEYQLLGLFRKKTILEKLRDGDHDMSEILPRGSQLERTIREEEEQVHQEEIQVNKTFAKKTSVEKNLGDLRNKLNEKKLQLRDDKKRKEELLKAREDLLGVRKEQQREAAKMRDEIEALTSRIDTIKRKLRSVVRGDVLEGIESVRKVLNAWRERDDRLDLINGVMGILLEGFTCTEPAVAFAAEVRAGERMFHHVVRNRKVISEVLNEITERKLGGIVCFIPLEDVEQRNFRYPENLSCKSMISFLEPREEFQKAVDFVFGSSVIVKNLEVGVAVGREYGLQAITLDGQQVLGKGKFKGGYRNRNFSRVELYREYSSAREKLDDLTREYRHQMYSVQRIEEELVPVMNQLQEINVKIQASGQNITELQVHVAEASISLESIEKSYFPLKRILDDSRMRLDESRGTRVEMEHLQEMPIEEVEEEIQRLQGESSELEKQKRQATELIPHLEGRLRGTREHLSHLQEDREKLEESTMEYSTEFLQERLVLVRQDQKKCKENLKEVSKELQEIRSKIIEFSEQLPPLERNLIKLSMKRDSALMTWEAAKEDVETMQSQVNSLEEKVKEWEERAGNLGPIPRIPNSRIFDNLGEKSLEKRMKDLRKEEDRLGPVNPNVKVRMQELEEELRFLETLMETEEERKANYQEKMMIINQKRFEALRVGFQRINEYFEEIFGEIVRNGRARLYPVDKRGRELDELRWRRVQGVRIKATFVGGQQMDKMNQFSGGQKTVMAVALIFAIHRFKPAPFYLLDEIDKALDQSFRASVAELIHRMSATAQFMTISFSGELLMQADTYFRVTSRRDSSHVEGCSREEAVEIVRRDSEEE
ncbi:structural maintenance of chromosomes protein 3 [Fopius arisanus]|uniref:Structural maintenance of chromosomes protein n=1 Tax=Fopius arisanus TaxID=64838 RepID=A0A9R1TC91_9HYME|nr:PREDICTED: structural maintenance of chromosomes protein 3-like [Fopius arisanus]